MQEPIAVGDVVIPDGRRRTNNSRRRFMLGGLAAVVGISALPFLPKSTNLNPDDLLKPGLAQASPQLLRDLCLEFYDHPKHIYRGAAAVHFAQFKDTEVQGVLFSRITAEPLPDVRQTLVKSLIQHADPATHARLAQVYWSNPDLRSTIDQLVLFLDFPALATAIQAARP